MHKRTPGLKMPDDLAAFLEQAAAADYRHVLSSLGFNLHQEETMAAGERLTTSNASGKIAATGRVRPLEWDSKFFGVPCGRFEGLFFASTDPNPLKTRLELLQKMTAMANAAGLDFLDCRIRADDLYLKEALEESGFFLCDELSIYQTELATDPENAQPTAKATPEWDKLAAFLERCLADMEWGRVFQDPNIDRKTARKFYLQACRHYLSEGAHVTAIEENGSLVGAAIGVVDAEISEQTGRRYGILWFITVDPAYRGQGFGKRLFDKFKQEFAVRAELLEIGTQSANTAANRIYLSAGCGPLARVMTFHKWGRA